MCDNVAKKACNDCPFRKTATPGWLGSASHDPVAFLNSFGNGETHLPCHSLVDWEARNAQELAEDAPVCRGAAIYLANHCKVPRDPSMAAAVDEVEPNDAFFRHASDFCQHHAPGTDAMVIGNRVVSSGEVGELMEGNDEETAPVCYSCTWEVDSVCAECENCPECCHC